MDEAQKLFDSVYTGLQIEEAVAAGLELRESPQLALANLGGRPNRNLAINPNFRINQRNFSSDNWTNGYGPDGWLSIGSGHLEYSGGAVKTINQYLLQYYEPGEIDAGIYTVSAFCTDNIWSTLGFWEGGEIAVSSANFENGFASVTLEIPDSIVDNTKKGFLYISCPSNGSISHIKVEKSPIQTAAYKTDSGNWKLFESVEYGKELARCQRYGIPVSGGIYVGNNYGDRAIIFIPTPVTLRAKPVIQVSNYGRLVFSGGETKTPTSIEVQSVESNGIKCAVNYSESVSGALASLGDLIAFISSEL